MLRHRHAGSACEALTTLPAESRRESDLRGFARRVSAAQLVDQLADFVQPLGPLCLDSRGGILDMELNRAADVAQSPQQQFALSFGQSDVQSVAHGNELSWR